MAIVAVLLVPGILLTAPTSRAETSATWTFAIYVAADNSLEPYWETTTLPFLQAVPASEEVNIVALLDMKSTSGIEIVKVSESTVTTVETLPEMDTGDPAALTWWIDRATTLWPSTYFAMSLWDHGFGWQFICSDDTSESQIDMPELESAITDAGDMIDLLAFDACNMAMAEVAYALSLTDLVQYMVASEEYGPGDGLPLDDILTELVNDPTMQPVDLASVMVDEWGAHYGKTNGGRMALASIDIAEFGARMGNFNNWSARMMDMLPTYQSYYENAVQKSHAMTAIPYFVDLYDLAYHLLDQSGITDATLRSLTTQVRSDVQAYVADFWGGPKMGDCGGITLFWADSNDWYWYGADYLETQFAADTSWGDFLEAINE
ncbi:MAG: clostripain-related cysteine peptidase [Thermoplasmata archaeon]|nr:clostripain-related cysteine peptidase [Thermoplasmata archaeon]